MQSLKQVFAVNELAQVLEVSRSGFADLQVKDQRPRRQTDQLLKPLRVQASVDSRRSYGSPRLRVQLQRAGYRCGKTRLRRLMRQLNPRPKQKRRFHPPSSQPDPPRAIAPNRLAQLPPPARPDQIWLGDITYHAPEAPGEGLLFGSKFKQDKGLRQEPAESQASIYGAYPVCIRRVAGGVLSRMRTPPRRFSKRCGASPR